MTVKFQMALSIKKFQKINLWAPAGIYVDESSLYSCSWRLKKVIYQCSTSWGKIENLRKSTYRSPSVARKIFHRHFLFLTAKNPNIPNFKARRQIYIFCNILIVIFFCYIRVSDLWKPLYNQIQGRPKNF